MKKIFEWFILFLTAILFVVLVCTGLFFFKKSKTEREQIALVESELQPQLILKTESADLSVDEDTNIVLHILIPEEWKKKDLKICDDNQTLETYSKEEWEAVGKAEKIGETVYEEYTVNFTVKAQDADDKSTAVKLYAVMGKEESNPVFLYRDIPVTDEMLDKAYKVLNEVSEAAKACEKEETLEDGKSVKIIDPKQVMKEVLSFLESHEDVSYVCQENEQMIYFATDDKISCMFSLTEVFEDENENLCGAGVTTDDKDLMDKFVYDDKFRLAPVNGDVLVMCPIRDTYPDRKGKGAEESGENLAKYLDSNCDVVTDEGEETAPMESIVSGSWADYGTVMNITHSSALRRGDGSEYIYFTTYSQKDALVAEGFYDNWFYSKKGLNSRNAIRYADYNSLVDKPDIRLALHENYTYKTATYFGKDYKILEKTYYDVGMTSNYLMYIYNKAKFPNTLFYLGSCESLRDGVFNQFLLSHGASAVVGYDEPVEIKVENAICKNIFSEMLKENTETLLFFRNNNVWEASFTSYNALTEVFGVLVGSPVYPSPRGTTEFVYEGHVQVFGCVKDENDEPVEDATVIARRYFNGHPQEEGETTTDSEGNYSFADLPWGMYLMQAHDGKGEDIYNKSLSGIIMEHVDFTLPGKKHLTGRVTDMDGSPIEDASVRIAMEDGDFKDRISTDEEGCFEIDLYAGKYSLVASKEGYGESDKVIIPIKEDDENVILLDDIILNDSNVINNGGRVVGYQGNTYYWKFNSDSFEETGIFANFSQNASAVNELICRKADGSETVLLSDTSYGPIYICGGRLFYQKEYISWSAVDLDGSNKTTYPDMRIMAADAPNEILVYEDCDDYNTYALTKNDSNILLAPEGSNALGIHDKKYYYSMNNENVMTIYSVNLDGTDTQNLGDIQIVLDGDSLINQGIAVSDVLFCKDGMYLAHGLYGGTGLFFSDGGVTKVGYNGGLETIVKAGTSEEMGFPKIYMEETKNGRTLYYYNGESTEGFDLWNDHWIANDVRALDLKSGKSTDADFVLSNIGDVVYENGCIQTLLDNSGEYTTIVSEKMLKELGFDEFGFLDDGMVAYVPYMDIIGDKAYFTISTAKEDSDASMGWRQGYRRLETGFYVTEIGSGKVECIYGYQ